MINSQIDNLSDWGAFIKQVKVCTKCSLHIKRNQVVFGSGNKNANIVFIGEAPGKKEDLLGLPFVGRSGKILDKILNKIKLSKKDVFILNILKCRPPDNRDPLKSEIEICEEYLKKQLKYIKPKLIVALGKIAANTILKNNKQLASLRKKIYNYENIDLIATYHPAALLRNSNLKIFAWEDFKLIKDKYL